MPNELNAVEELPIDTRRQIFIHETIRDYKPSNHSNVATAISNSCLTEPERKELLLSLEKQSKLLYEMTTNVLFPLLHRSIPSNYVLNEITSLEKSGKIEVGITEFISNAIHAGFSLDGSLEYLREQIKEERENKKSKQ